MDVVHDPDDCVGPVEISLNQLDCLIDNEVSCDYGVMFVF